MAKLSILATTLALLVVIATASVTITTVEIDESNPSQQRCEQQLRRQTLKNCKEFLMECSRRMILNTSCREKMKECCGEVKEMDEECRCQGIKKMMQRQQGQMGRQEMEKMVEKAMELPRMCGCRQDAARFIGSFIRCNVMGSNKAHSSGFFKLERVEHMEMK